MKSITTLLVGTFHRGPPAPQILASLPSGAELFLEREPENPYDHNAIKVWADPLHCDWTILETEMAGTGYGMNDPDLKTLCHIGYVAKTGGKPLEKAGLTVGNVEVLDILIHDPDATAMLGFTDSGQPLVIVSGIETSWVEAPNHD